MNKPGGSNVERKMTRSLSVEIAGLLLLVSGILVMTMSVTGQIDGALGMIGMALAFAGGVMMDFQNRRKPG